MRRGNGRSDGRGDAERDAARRAEALVERVLSGSPPAAPTAPPPLDLAPALTAMEDELWLLGAGGSPAADAPVPELVLALAPGLPPIRVERERLRELVRQLVANAAEAVRAAGAQPERGRVVVTTRAVGGRVALGVRDTGLGMDAATLARAFDPFFTTKAEHSGLGLAAVRRIARGCGAEVRIDSRLGRGSVLTVLFPVRPEDLPASGRRPEPGRSARAAAVRRAGFQGVLKKPFTPAAALARVRAVAGT